MTFYVRTPESMMEARRRWMRHMIENSFDGARSLNFPMELMSTKDEYVLTAMLPGLSADEVTIEYNNDSLTIEGEYKNLHDEKIEVMFSEFPVGRFSRAVELKEPIKSDEIQAAMKDGVLTIRVPKAEESKPKTIKIVAK